MDRLVKKMDCTCFPNVNVDSPPKSEFGARCWMSHVQVTRWMGLHCCSWLCLQIPAYNHTVPAAEHQGDVFAVLSVVLL